jgi:hypothetical protein
MILTPKNWHSFQHYKDREPSWIKLHKGLLTNYEFVCLPIASKALAPMLWLLASEYKDGVIDASVEKIAFRLSMTREDLLAALKPLVDVGFFDASDALAGPEQTACLEEDTNTTEEKEVEKNISSAPRPKNDDFENLKRVYPRRNGNYGWKAAERKFNALVKTGVDPEVIIAAARRLGDALRAKVGTEFIPMPASWLNSEDFTEVAVQSFAERPEELDWEQVVSVYRRTGHWSRWAGPDPDSPACRAPPQLLEKYGIRGDSLPAEHRVQ